MRVLTIKTALVCRCERKSKIVGIKEKDRKTMSIYEEERGGLCKAER